MVSTEAFCLLLLFVVTEQVDVNRIRRQCPCAQIVANPCSCQVGIVPQCNCVQPVYQQSCSCGFQPQAAQCKYQCQQSCMSVCSGDVVTTCPSLCRNTCSQSCAPQPDTDIRLVMPLSLATSSRCVPVCQQACSNSCSPRLHFTSCVPVCKESCQKKCAQFTVGPMKDCSAVCRPACSADCVNKISETPSDASVAEAETANQPAQVLEASAPADVPLPTSNPIDEFPRMPEAPTAPNFNVMDETPLSTINPDASGALPGMTAPVTAIPQDQPTLLSYNPGLAEPLQADAQAAPISEPLEAPQAAANPPGLISTFAPASLHPCIDVCMPNCDPACIKANGPSASNLPIEQSVGTMNGGQQPYMSGPNVASTQQLETDIQNQDMLVPLQGAPNGQSPQYGNEIPLNAETPMSPTEEANFQELSAPAAMPVGSSVKEVRKSE